MHQNGFVLVYYILVQPHWLFSVSKKVGESNWSFIIFESWLKLPLSWILGCLRKVVLEENSQGVLTLGITVRNRRVLLFPLCCLFSQLADEGVYLSGPGPQLCKRGCSHNVLQPPSALLPGFPSRAYWAPEEYDLLGSEQGLHMHALRSRHECEQWSGEGKKGAQRETNTQLLCPRWTALLSQQMKKMWTNLQTIWNQVKNCLELIWARLKLVREVKVRIRRLYFSLIIEVPATCASGGREQSHSLVMVSVSRTWQRWRTQLPSISQGKIWPVVNIFITYRWG